MNNILEKYLYNKYPDLFQDHSKPMTESCMCWGCSCGDGWFLLLDRLCSQITNHIKIKNEQFTWYNKWEKEKLAKDEKIEPCSELIKECPPVRFNQVKEKFGALRIYYSGGDQEVSAMISFAESLSRYICENCGKFDTTVGSTTIGWTQSICEECISKETGAKKNKGWALFQSNKDAERLMNRVVKDQKKNKGKEMKRLFEKVDEIKSRSKNNKTHDN